MASTASVEAHFIYRFPTAENRHVYRAPGRVNLIGEHTDYNQGLVLPMAIQLACYAVVGTTNDDRLRVYSESQKDGREWTIEQLRNAQPEQHWSDYFVGVAQQVLKAGYTVHPGSVLLHSTVPMGGGLSSSAAIEVATALALLNGQPIEPLALVQICKRAENEFVGVPSGIMDQYVSVFGQAQNALELDCRTLTHRYVPLPDGLVLVAVNSMVKHSLGTSAYRDRVRECAEAAEILGVPSLRDATPATVEEARGRMPDVVYRRARHITTENDRVEAFVRASLDGNLQEMGRLLTATHRSLRDDFEVSAEELDFLVDAAMTLDGVYGSRMIGGGFGGCTLTMMRPDTLDHFEEHIAKAYNERFGIRPELYPCSPSAGAGPAQTADTEN